MAGGNDYRSAGRPITVRDRWSQEDRREISGTPEWILASEYLSDAFHLAARAHGSERRPSDGRLFLEHVSEVAGLLQRLEFDEDSKFYWPRTTGREGYRQQPFATTRR